MTDDRKRSDNLILSRVKFVDEDVECSNTTGWKSKQKRVTDLPGFRELLGLHRSVHYCLSAFPHEVGRALWVAVHGPGAREA